MARPPGMGPATDTGDGHGAGDGALLHAWLAAVPAALRPQLDEACVVEWGFGAGPAYAGIHVEACAPLLTLREAIDRVVQRRSTLRRAHVRLVDGTRLVFEPSGLRWIERR